MTDDVAIKIREHQATQDEVAKALGYYLIRNRARLSSALNDIWFKMPPKPDHPMPPITGDERAKIIGALSDILHNLNRNGGVHDARKRDIERLRARR